MDPRMQHAFVNKPFYKSFRKCTGCKKRNIFSRVAKCSGCKRYCHRRCMLLMENNTCCGPILIEPTSKETLVTRSIEDDQDLNMALRPEEDNCSAESNLPDNVTKVSCTEGIESAERWTCSQDDGDLETGTGPQDENIVVKNDELMPDVGQIAEDAMPAEDVRIMLLVILEVLIDEALSTLSDDESSIAKDEVKADESFSTPSAVRITADETSEKPENEQQHTRPIQICSSLELALHRLSDSKEAEMGEGDIGGEKNECCCDGDENNKQGDDGDQKDVPGENKLD